MSDPNTSSKVIMMRIRMLLLAVLALTSATFSVSHATTAAAPLAASGIKPPIIAIGPWQPAPGLEQVRIWPGDAPDGTFRPQPPESVETYDDAGAVAGKSQAVLNIAVPTMTIIPAKGHKTGMAVIVFLGEGFRRSSSI